MHIMHKSKSQSLNLLHHKLWLVLRIILLGHLLVVLSRHLLNHLLSLQRYELIEALRDHWITSLPLFDHVEHLISYFFFLSQKVLLIQGLIYEFTHSIE